MTRIIEESTVAEPDTRRIFSSRRTLRSRILRQESTPAASVRKRSPRDPDQTEFQLCAECHGGTGPSAGSPLEITQLASARSRSYHPLQAPSTETAPSVFPEFAGREVNCTDCHGNSDPSAIRGPHGSNVRFILRTVYQTADGNEESAEIYALCYECHDRELVLDSTLFPEHRLHVVDERVSCATCHDPHGSAEHRSLIRFGQETVTAGVLPSIEANRLAFESTGPGAGACYLTCHGFDHGPEWYGGALPGQRELDSEQPFPGDLERVAPRRGRSGRRPLRR
jgi:predicted CXXCH cytochrome family protein